MERVRLWQQVLASGKPEHLPPPKETTAAVGGRPPQRVALGFPSRELAYNDAIACLRRFGVLFTKDQVRRIRCMVMLMGGWIIARRLTRSLHFPTNTHTQVKGAAAAEARRREEEEAAAAEAQRREEEASRQYCWCRKGYGEGVDEMVQCGSCQEWYHYKCVLDKLGQKELDEIMRVAEDGEEGEEGEKWYCKRACLEEEEDVQLKKKENNIHNKSLYYMLVRVRSLFYARAMSGPAAHAARRRAASACGPSASYPERQP